MEDFERYNTDEEMKTFLSNKYRYTLFRKLWVIMAQIEKELGLNNITPEIMKDLKNNMEFTDEDLPIIKEEEIKTKHEVMAQINAFKKRLTPEAAKIIHLGCTSCYVQDNADMLTFINAMYLIRNKTISLVQRMAKFSDMQKSTICVGYTHLQVAQFVTLGKRMSLFTQDFWFDLKGLEETIDKMHVLGCQGATGTKYSYVQLLGKEKALLIDEKFAEQTGRKVIPLSGQTYPRKMDNIILTVLRDLASSAHRIALNIRLWQSRYEVSEPFEQDQIGSSAMPWKRNPMRCERINSLARLVIALATVDNNAHQMDERTLDDSANRRLVMKMCLTLVNYMITLLCNIVDGLKVFYPNIESKVIEELNSVVAEPILMEMCKLGHDRQEVHEKLKFITLKLRDDKTNGINGNIADAIKQDKYFQPIHDQIDTLMNPNLYIGLCPEQVDNFHFHELQEYLEYPCKPFDTSFVL